jgi:hypothetical protein
MEYPRRIELTEEICDIVDHCPRQQYLAEPGSKMGEVCSDNCPLFGVCLERLTGDQSAN